MHSHRGIYRRQDGRPVARQSVRRRQDIHIREGRSHIVRPSVHNRHIIVDHTFHEQDLRAAPPIVMIPVALDVTGNMGFEIGVVLPTAP